MKKENKNKEKNYNKIKNKLFRFYYELKVYSINNNVLI